MGEIKYMTKLKIAFDVDDTLIIPTGAFADEPHPYCGFYGAVPNYKVIEIFHFFESQGNEMFIWSGGGVDYARTWAEKLGLNAQIIVKQKREDVDIAFDDCDVDLAKVNVKVKRINNSISRK
jgi:hypothetical protein